MKRYLFLLFSCMPFVGEGQIIDTWAGNGTNTNTGDGGLAIIAGIYHPLCGVFDKNGNYYVCSGIGHKIRKIGTNGIITTTAGTGSLGYNGDGGLADTSKLWEPASVIVDSLGNIFIVDGRNYRIRKIEISTGIITTIAGTGVQGFSGDNGPASLAMLYANDICFDKFGNLYISDVGNLRIRKINSAGIITTVVGTGIAGYNGDNILAINAQIYGCRGIAVDSAGNLYLAENNGSRVRKVDIATGIITTVAGTGGNPMYNGDNIPATSASINPVRVTFDKQGFLYITDNSNNRIRKVDENGLIHTVAGIGTVGYTGDGGAATLAELNSPSGITFDSCNNLYITEVNQGRIRKVTFHPDCFPTSIIPQTAPLSFTLSPNPATSQLTITSNTHIKDISITNTLGQQVFHQTSNTQKTIIDIAVLAPGIYFLKLTDSYNNIRTEKLVKQ